MAVGWYKTRSGVAFYGTLPKDAEPLDGSPAVEGPAMPTRSANKQAWIDWAVVCGWAPEDAERKTKAQLVAELGQQPVDAGQDEGTVDPEVAGVDLGSDLAEGGLIEGGPLVGEQGPELTTFEGDTNIVRHGDEG